MSKEQKPTPKPKREPRRGDVPAPTKPTPLERPFREDRNLPPVETSPPPPKVKPPKQK